jgi:hypothetical protein
LCILPRFSFKFTPNSATYILECFNLSVYVSFLQKFYVIAGHSGRAV